jgi:hypothetical protein
MAVFFVSGFVEYFEVVMSLVTGTKIMPCQAPASMQVLTRILSSQILFFNSKKEYPENAARC